MGLLASLVSCAYPRLAQAPPPTSAFDRPADTGLGRAAAPGIEGHPGSSGLYVLRNGLDAFAARWGLIERAEMAVDLQAYILSDDVTGRLLLGRLLAAGERGVRVRLLVDDHGTQGIDRLLAAADAHPGIEVRLFNPFARGPLPGLARWLDLIGRFRRLNRRMHNKLLTADGAAGIVGGRNLADEYFDAHGEVNFADLDLLVFGPVVSDLSASFDLYWNSPYAVPVAAWSSMRVGQGELAELQAELADHTARHADSPYAERVRASDLVAVTAGELELLWAPMHVVADLPRKIVARGDEVAETLLTTRMRALLPEAQRELDVISPYFVPGAPGTARLAALAERGVRVRVLTNSLAATDVAAVHAGYVPSRRPLLQAGVELYELKQKSAALAESHRRGLFGSSQASLHAKTFTIDERTVFVGSLNIDPRSVSLNTELGLVVESPELAAALSRDFEMLIGPQLSYSLGLEPRGDRALLVWHGEEDGRALSFRNDPGTSVWTRFAVGLLSILPIDGQL